MAHAQDRHATLLTILLIPTPSIGAIYRKQVSLSGQRLKERQIEIFCAVMANISLSAAAGHPGVSHPSISMALKRLEDQLGIRLFDRTSGRLVATAEARLIDRQRTRLNSSH